MQGFLKIYNLKDLNNQEITIVQDWQRDGYFGNYTLGLHHCPDLNLIPFFFKTIKGLVVEEFKLRQVQVGSRREKIVTSNVITLDTSWMINNTGTYYDHWTFLAENAITYPGAGIYEFYIKFNFNYEYISELLCIPNEDEIIECLADFNNDFNNDYFTCE